MPNFYVKVCDHYMYSNGKLCFISGLLGPGNMSFHFGKMSVEEEYKMALVLAISKVSTHAVRECISHLKEVNRLPVNVPLPIMAKAEEEMKDLLKGERWTPVDFLTYTLCNVKSCDKESMEIFSLVASKFTGTISEPAMKLICWFFGECTNLLKAVKHLLPKMDKTVRYQVPGECHHVIGSPFLLLLSSMMKRNRSPSESIDSMQLLIENGYELVKEGREDMPFTLVSHATRYRRWKYDVNFFRFVVEHTPPVLFDIPGHTVDPCLFLSDPVDTDGVFFYQCVTPHTPDLPTIIAEYHPTLSYVQQYLSRFCLNYARELEFVPTGMLQMYLRINAAFWSCHDFITSELKNLLCSCRCLKCKRRNRLLMVVRECGYNLKMQIRGSEGPLKLTSLSRLAIRKRLTTFCPPGHVESLIGSLKLPTILHDFVAMKDVRDTASEISAEEKRAVWCTHYSIFNQM